MDKVTFQHLLDNPDRLLALPLPELEQLASTYPYSANLRLLLLLRLKLEGQPDERDLLARTAAATFDRAHLYDLLRDLERNRHREEDEETLELIGLDELREERLTAPEESLPSRLNERQLTPPTDEPNPDPAEPSLPESPPTTVLIGVHDYSPPAEWAASAVALLEALPARPLPPGEVRPERLDRFLATGRQPKPLRRRLRELREKTLPAAAAPSGRNLDRIAHESVVDHAAVASETLARLLVQQGQYRNAIKMYRRLILLNPDKKAIFAGLIKELKEKL